MNIASISRNRKYLLIFGDVVILYTTLWITLLLRFGTDYTPALWYRHVLPFTVVFAIWLVIFYIDDLYELSLVHGKMGILGRIFRSLLIGAVIAVLFFYLGQNRLFTIRPQTVLVINTALACGVIYGWHLLYFNITKASRHASAVLIVGYNHLVPEIVSQIGNRPELGMKVHSVIVENSGSVPQSVASLVRVQPYANLKQFCLDHHIDTIVSTIHPRSDSVLSKSLFECLPLKINFFDSATLYEKITGKVPVNTIEQAWFLENLTESNKKLYELIKRTYDIVLSLVLLIGTLPITPLVALLIKIDSRGTIFFSQTRTGKDNQTFKAIKFRTMVANAESAGPQWAQQNDPRVTRLGRFLRKTRIDEIPQLYNVIKGDMSLIGPRPERPEFIEKLQQQIPFYKERLLIKPGLTGWAQVAGPAYGGSVEESLEKLQYDLFYIKNRSIALDLSIALKTIKTILSRRGV